MGRHWGGKSLRGFSHLVQCLISYANRSVSSQCVQSASIENAEEQILRTGNAKAASTRKKTCVNGQVITAQKGVFAKRMPSELFGRASYTSYQESVVS